ncbi:NUDIX hydrolase [Specibacter cremeus]|uniref:NUDIX hydrolase n=1 Tax=Specibacter cremeus TaxID=1629051 RepID=UPI000F7AB852|nr:CoA pyrophosphatase [Specibacter cremeus]
MSAYADLVELARRAAAGEIRFKRESRPEFAIDPATVRPAAVLLLFGALDSVPAVSEKPLISAQLDLLLVERATTLSDHPGQVAFPGGGVDPGDASLVAAALRETEEETGADPSGIEVLGTLPEVPLAVSNFLVTPVLGWWASQSPVAVVDYGESAQVFRVPVRDLLDPDNRFTVVLRRGDFVYRGPAFRVNGVTVWGFTAGILAQVLEELGWAVPWDANREIPAPT